MGFRSKARHGLIITPVLKTAVYFNLSNNQANSDIRFIFDGDAFLPRIGHTAIGRYTPFQQTGYGALFSHTPNGGPGTWDDGDYSWITCIYPGGNGSVNGNGQALDQIGSSGTVHYWEQAGLNDALDLLASPGGSAVEVIKDVEYIVVRKSRQIVGGGDDGKYEHIFKIYLTDGTPVHTIRKLLNSLNNPTGGSNPAFIVGAHDYTASGNANSETPHGILNGLQLYGWLDDADHEVEMMNVTSNTPQTAAGIAGVHYINQNLTPSDISDKSGQGNNPRWDNDNRPTLLVL